MINEHYNRFIKIIADEEECVFIIPTSVLKQANIDIFDQCIVVAEPDECELRIKKAE